MVQSLSMKGMFDGIIGHQAQKEYLQGIVGSDRIAHGFCFSGDEHLGKSLIAERFVAQILGISPEKIRSHPDVVYVERIYDEKKEEFKSSIGVDEVRALPKHFSLSSITGGTKVAIIEHAGAMTTAAQNALLKTLEEPSGKSLIILIARKPEALLDTILSRVVHLKFALVARESICDELKKTVNEDTAHELAGVASGRPGVAQNLLEAENREAYDEQLESSIAFVGASLAERMKNVEKLSKELSKSELQNQISIWRSVIHDCLLYSENCQHLLSHSKRTDEIAQLIETRKQTNWVKVLEAIGESEVSLRYNGNVTLALEHFVLAF